MLFAPYYSQEDALKKSDEALLNDLIKKIQYRSKEQKYIIPYIKVRLKEKNGLCPFKSITVGPGQNQEIIYKSLIMLVQSRFPNENAVTDYSYHAKNGCSYVTVNGIEVRRSLIPFRG